MIKITKHPAYPYALPFALFMAFLAIETSIAPCLKWLGMENAAQALEGIVYITYPIKTLVVGVAVFWSLSKIFGFAIRGPWISIITGILVFVIWVGLDPFLFKLGDNSGGFQPFLFENKEIAWGLVAFRILGASLVVPFMEEIFWRGFLMRILIQNDFEAVPLGKYTHTSFWITAVLVAFAHNQIVLGFLAGAIYGGLFTKTRSLGSVVLAHGITNLLLGLYVLHTGKWYFW